MITSAFDCTNMRATASPIPELPPITMTFISTSFSTNETNRLVIRYYETLSFVKCYTEVDMPRAGRPRSELSRCRILETALRLARTRGYAKITMDEIAAEAGAGKQTIYRWWRSKAEVVLDALKENARVEIITPDTGSLRK